MDISQLYTFECSQLDKTMSSVFHIHSYDDLQITKNRYKLCQIVNNNYHGYWNRKINICFLEYHGFDNLQDFKNVYSRCLLYNAIRFNPSQTIRQFITNMCVKNKSYNILEFLTSLDIDELLCVEW